MLLPGFGACGSRDDPLIPKANQLSQFLRSQALERQKITEVHMSALAPDTTGFTDSQDDWGSHECLDFSPLLPPMSGCELAQGQKSLSEPGTKGKRWGMAQSQCTNGTPSWKECGKALGLTPKFNTEEETKILGPPFLRLSGLLKVTEYTEREKLIS